nr:SsrA-binding protein [Flavobacterium croceum]
MYKLLAQLNKILLPSFTKQKLDVTKATRFQKAILAWRYFVTTRALK